MGWLFKPGYSRSELIAHLTQPEETEWQSSRRVAHCLRGNVLWSVVEVTAKRDLLWLACGKTGRYISCDLLSRGSSGWGYKDMCEDMEPCYYTCPLSYLRMTPIASLAWREKVYATHGKPRELARFSYQEDSMGSDGGSTQLSLLSSV